MLKTTTTVKARDTSSAMEKVITELGNDCVILSTKKKNGFVEITASNLTKYKTAVKKRYDKEKFSNIYNLKSGKLKINKENFKNLSRLIEEITKIIIRPNNIKTRCLKKKE